MEFIEFINNAYDDTRIIFLGIDVNNLANYNRVSLYCIVITFCKSV